tara:strand:- start:286 stop:489 length:204 start_codon:yes stop_codon:yes gene_type:complete
MHQCGSDFAMSKSAPEKVFQMAPGLVWGCLESFLPPHLHYITSLEIKGITKYAVNILAQRARVSTPD